MCKERVALVAVCDKWRYEIEIAWCELVVAFGQWYACGAFGDEVETGEGASHIFPVPVAIMTGIPHVEGEELQLFDRDVHYSWFEEHVGFERHKDTI